MKSSRKLDDQTKLSRLMGALSDSSERPIAELGLDALSASSIDALNASSIDELTRELETHGIKTNTLYSGVATIFQKAGLPPPPAVKAEPEWLSRAREKKRWFQDKLKQVKESAQESLNIGPQPVPVFFRNQKSIDRLNGHINGTPASDQETLMQDQRLLDLIDAQNATVKESKHTPEME